MAASHQRLRQMTILLAEDEENDVVLFKRALVKAGLNVGFQRVNDGEEAISYLKGVNKFEDRKTFPLPDLLVVDLKMPKRTGFEVIDWVRKSNSKRLRIVVLSSSHETQDINRAYENGANSYVAKPPTFDQLVTTVKNLHTYWCDISETPDIPQA